MNDGGRKRTSENARQQEWCGGFGKHRKTSRNHWSKKKKQRLKRLQRSPGVISFRCGLHLCETMKQHQHTFINAYPPVGTSNSDTCWYCQGKRMTHQQCLRICQCSLRWPHLYYAGCLLCMRWWQTPRPPRRLPAVQHHAVCLMTCPRHRLEHRRKSCFFRRWKISSLGVRTRKHHSFFKAPPCGLLWFYLEAVSVLMYF